jgi:hypothetical protein
MENIPDNYDLFEQHEREQDCISRMRKRQELSYEAAELNFVDVPNDYGTHKELY